VICRVGGFASGSECTLCCECQVLALECQVLAWLHGTQRGVAAKVPGHITAQ